MADAAKVNKIMLASYSRPVFRMIPLSGYYCPIDLTSDSVWEGRFVFFSLGCLPGTAEIFLIASDWLSNLPALRSFLLNFFSLTFLWYSFRDSANFPSISLNIVFLIDCCLCCLTFFAMTVQF